MGTREVLIKARWRRDNLKDIRKKRAEKTKLARKALRILAFA